MDDNAKLLRDVADLYYNQDLKQADIGKRYGISRAKISRMLAEARDTGIVKIFIQEAKDDMVAVENRLANLFELQGVKVVSVPSGERMLALQSASQEAAKYIANYIQDGDKVGVSWGVTLHEISKNLPLLNLSNTKIVQLSGNLDNADSSNYATQIAYNFATRLSSESVSTLPCPVILDNPLILDILLHDENISKIIKLGKECNKMVVNIGLPVENNCLISSGYVKPEILENLQEHGVVGSITSHFYNQEGQLVDLELDKRTVGVGLETIRNCECVISCVIGGGKETALYAALKAGLLDILVVDYDTANELVKMASK